MKTKIRFKKLDARGFSHDIAIVVVAVIFGISGVAYLVASHADSCTPVSGATSSATSSPTSSPACNPASGPVSSTNPVVAGSCTIVGVPANSSNGQQISPTVTYTNTGSQSFSTVANGQIEVTGGTVPAPDMNSVSIKAVSLKPGQSITVDTGLHYTAGYKSSSAQQVSFTVSNSNPVFSCSASTTLPSTPAPTPAKLAGACSISGVPSRPTYKQVIKPRVIVSNKGTAAFQPKIVGRLQLANNNSNAAYTLATLQPGGSSQQALRQYVTQQHSGNITQGTYSVTSTQPNFSCSASFKLP